MVSMTIYAEGGNKPEKGKKTKSLNILFGKGFKLFLERAGLGGHMPRVIACGGRDEAYKDFCTAMNNDEQAFLLVDSEMPVTQDPSNANPWRIIKWNMPSSATPGHFHLMVQCMEAWFLADPDTLKHFFGNGFSERRLPPSTNIETIAKEKIYDGLEKATGKTQKGKYSKGRHSFEILGKIDPQKVIGASPWARRFITGLKREMGVP